MSETFECGNKGALVAYLYEECEPKERAVIASHLARCATCASEVDGLGWTRRQLEVWTPQVPELGFRLPAAVVEPRLPWWRAPLPAWAQAVAALLIFGAGLSIGLTRGAAPVTEQATQVAAVPPADSVSRTDLAQLEQQLKAEMSQLRATVPTSAPQRVSASDDIMKKVEELVTQSEERQRREFTLRSVELARDIEAQRRIDLASVRETFGQFQGVAGTEMRQQREAIDRINNFIRVSQQGR